MIESMKVSIIVPVYNVAKYIERCLLSVLDQTWQDLEVILVNDCTPDNSMEIARRVVASHPRGTVVRCLEHEENRGLQETPVFQRLLAIICTSWIATTIFQRMQ